MQRAFKELSQHRNLLSRSQRDALSHALHALNALNGREDAAKLIETARAATLACPRCRCPQHRRHGLQRFRCIACGRTYNSLTGTPMAGLRKKEKWLTYCQYMLDPGNSVRRAARCVEVHRNTSFRWRHQESIKA